MADTNHTLNQSQKQLGKFSPSNAPKRKPKKLNVKKAGVNCIVATTAKTAPTLKSLKIVSYGNYTTKKAKRV